MKELEKKILEILTRYENPIPNKKLKDAIGNLKGFSIILDHNETVTQLLELFKEERERLYKKVEDMKSDTLPDDFGIGNISVNGRMFLADREQCEMLNELVKENNKKIDKTLKNLKLNHTDK